jgi:hypothetical protein
MTRSLAIAALILIPACPSPPQPPPPPDVMDAQPPDSCASRCAAARARGCREGFGNDAGTCEGVCTHAVTTLHTPLDALFRQCTVNP